MIVKIGKKNVNSKNKKYEFVCKINLVTDLLLFKKFLNIFNCNFYDFTVILRVNAYYTRTMFNNSFIYFILRVIFYRESPSPDWYGYLVNSVRFGRPEGNSISSAQSL